MARGKPTHVVPWAGQDWRTSRIRARSIQAGDPWLRLVYLEALNALQEAGGELSSDSESLQDILGCPAAEIERCLPILDRIARTPGCRGGLLVADGVVSNLRMTEYIRARSELVCEGGKGRSKQRWGEGGTEGLTRSERLSRARALGRHTDEEWLDLVQALGSKCLRCGVAATDLRGGVLTRDHVVPPSKGGSDAIDNLQPLCRQCNNRKRFAVEDYRPKDWRERLEAARRQRMTPSLSVPNHTVPTPNRRKSTATDAALRQRVDRDETRSIVALYAEILPGKSAAATLPKLEAADRFLKAGFSYESARVIFLAVNAARDRDETRTLTSWAAHHNTALPYILRPREAQTIVAEAEDAASRSRAKRSERNAPPSELPPLEREPAAVAAWDAALKTIGETMNRHSFATWFRPTYGIRILGERLLVEVPSAQFQDWLERNYADVVKGSTSHPVVFRTRAELTEMLAEKAS